MRQTHCQDFGNLDPESGGSECLALTPKPLFLHGRVAGTVEAVSKLLGCPVSVSAVPF